MKKILIIGSGGEAKKAFEIIESLKKEHYNIEVVNDSSINGIQIIDEKPPLIIKNLVDDAPFIEPAPKTYNRYAKKYSQRKKW